MNIPLSRRLANCVTGFLLAGCVLGFTHRASADQVILDDLIVVGSLCVGQDCVNGESFGFDTIRLKENNLRIHFQDTSTSASFPTNDWRITINDSSNGGANRFSIDDVDGGRTPFTIEASAPSHSLYVDDGGRIGLGTSTPVADVHVKSGNTPTMRLEQDGSSGFTAQTWDVAGNEANFFIRDATSGSTLPFRLYPGAPTNALTIAADGDIGIGTNSPNSYADVHIQSTDDAYLYITTSSASDWVGVYMDNDASGAGGFTFGLNGSGDFQITEDSTGGTEFLIDQDATGNDAKFNFQDGGTQLVEIQADGDVNSATGVFGTISDRNAKTDIKPVDSQEVLARVAELPISTWRYKANSDELHMGPMAQDFWAAFRLHEGDKSIALNDLSGVALAAIQALNEQLAEREEVLNAELSERDEMIRKLETRLAELEARLSDE